MKLLLSSIVFLLFVIFFDSCIKNATPPQQILSGYTDSGGYHQFVYTDDKITEVHLMRNNAVIDTPYLRYNYGPSYVKKTYAFDKDFYIEYSINSYDLPTAIKPHPTAFNGIYNAHFYYKSGTDMLDSVMENSISGYTKYIPVYTNKNITELKIIQYYPNSNEVDTLPEHTYTYTDAPNVIRSSNSLLYIYVDGVARNELNIPLLFSANTLDSFSLGPDIYKYENGRFMYQTNSQGNITTESYGAGIFPYYRTYTYH